MKIDKPFNSKILNFNGEYTDDFMELLEELRPQTKTISNRLFEWCKEHDVDTADLRLLNMVVRELFELNLMYEWMTVLTQSKFKNDRWEGVGECKVEKEK